MGHDDWFSLKHHIQLDEVGNHCSLMPNSASPSPEKGKIPEAMVFGS
jgi:hypothetical protein